MEKRLLAIGTDATDMDQRLTAQLSRSAGLTETLKAADPLAWVQHINSIRARVREIVNSELIYS